MRLLLDTHVLLWAMLDADRLGHSSKTMIARADEVFVSSVSLWELAIKNSVGKLAIDLAKLEAAVLAAGYRPLPVAWAHALALGGLPPIHRDPFDRMLVAQAISEPMHLLTPDKALAAYGPQVVVI